MSYSLMNTKLKTLDFVELQHYPDIKLVMKPLQNKIDNYTLTIERKASNLEGGTFS